MKIKNGMKVTRLLMASAIVALMPLINGIEASASPIMGRSVMLSNSAGGASGVSYALSTTSLPSSTVVKSLQIQFCTSLTDSCASSPSGFSSSSSTLASQPTGLGSASGWTVDDTLSSALRITNTSNSSAPSGAVSATWNNVTNPSSPNVTFYGIITTYSNADWTSLIDSGTIALSTSTQIQVSLTVNEALTFCTGTSITGQNCATASGNLVDLGTGSSTSTATGTSLMAASTNGSTGYSISVKGVTLSSGSNTITALSSGGTSTVGSKQFGINLAGNNTVPAVGAIVSGSGTGSATANYGTNNSFRFADGETIASASGPTNSNMFTISYIANIDGMAPAGVYSTVLTYVATANY